MIEMLEIKLGNDKLVIYSPSPSGADWVIKKEHDCYRKAADFFAEKISKNKNIVDIKNHIDKYVDEIQKVMIEYHPHYLIKYSPGKYDGSVRISINTTNLSPRDRYYSTQDDSLRKMKSTFYTSEKLLIKSANKNIGYLPKWLVDKELIEVSKRGMYKSQRFTRYSLCSVCCPEPIISELRDAHLQQLPTQESIDKQIHEQKVAAENAKKARETERLEQDQKLQALKQAQIEADAKRAEKKAKRDSQQPHRYHVDVTWPHWKSKKGKFVKYMMSAEDVTLRIAGERTYIIKGGGAKEIAVKTANLVITEHPSAQEE